MEQTNKNYMILESKHIMRSILLLALPIMFSNILKSIHDIVDMYFVSNLKINPVEVEAMVSAITVTNPIIMIFQSLASGLMVAGAALMSQYIGAGRHEKARLTSAQLLSLCIFIGIAFNVILFFSTGPILSLMGAEGLVYKYAKEYVTIRSFELTGLFAFFAFQATRQSMGDTLTPVILNVGSVLINIVLTGIMVGKFQLAGAAYATVIGNMIIIPVCFIMMTKTKNEEMKLKFSDMKPNMKVIGKLFKLGLPAAMSQAFTSLGFLIINSIILGFEPYIISGIGVGNRINGILLFPAMGVGTVLATFIGQNIGAGNIERAKKCFVSALVLSLIITVVGSVILFFVSEEMAMIFIKDNPKALESCVNYLYFLIVGLPLMGLFQIFVGLFQGAGRTDYSLILSALRLWVLRIPVILLYIHVFNIGEASVWYAMVISNFGATIIGIILYQFVDYLPRTSNMKKKLLELEGEDENGRINQTVS